MTEVRNVLLSSTRGATPDMAHETWSLVTINRIPLWRNAQTGRTFPQVAGGEDPPPGEGDPPADGKSGGGANDDETQLSDETRGKLRAYRDGEKRFKALLKQQNDELEALKTKQRQVDEASLSETERLRNRAAELERATAERDTELQDMRNRRAIDKAAHTAGAADADDVYRLLDPADFEHDDKGDVTNAEALVKDLLEKKPYLKGKAATTAVPGTPRSNGTQSHDDRVKENIKKLQASGRYEPL